MPKIAVEIEYNTPDDPLWLNPDNVSLCLHAYCKNTKFSVSWAPNGNPWATPNQSETGTIAQQPQGATENAAPHAAPVVQTV